MKALLFAVLVLFSSYAQALTFQELINQTPGGKYVRTMPCYVGEVTDKATHVCIEFEYKKIRYRAAVKPDTQEVEHILTPKSEKFPDGEVPLEYFQYAGSI